MLIDSHCHLDFEIFDTDRDAIISRCHASRIDHIVVPAVSAARWDKLLSVTENSPCLHFALGLHPMLMAQHKKDDMGRLVDYTERFKPLAIGEIGLDFYMKTHDKASQIELFETQLLLAKKSTLPVILHVRKAHDKVITLLKKYNINGGIVHAFNGSLQQAKQYISLGFLLGIGAVITHEKATHIRQLFSQLPLSAIALETDAPDMAPKGQAGQRNSPESITIIANTLSQLREQDKNTIAAKTSENVIQALHLPVSPEI